MRFGTSFALAAMADAAAVRDFAQALDGAGFDYVTLSGHLLSAEAGRYPDRPAPTYVGPFHEPFVLFSYLAGITRRLAFRTSILILPLFPTAIVAKQAAELSLLSGGRFELGVGLSWNPAEYQAIGQEFRTRGRRIAEQITLLRRLWSEPFVSFKGRWHTFNQVGLNRLPAAPIPIWMGGGNDEPVLRRIARLADGWVPLADPTEALPRLRTYLSEAGRDPAHFGLTARLVLGPEGAPGWIETARRLQSSGWTDLTLSAPPDLPSAQALPRLIEARTALAEALNG
ncbi:MAG TPA: TIGR03619 family F420-dependent LLM class oxidoreductase [Dehalococcoidia bacterium]|nr:TIGR03619 family F420-dependent LLM class oxidoreductase [Dehalococcoidia bacterium]